MPASRVTSYNPWHIVLVLDDSGSMRQKSDGVSSFEHLNNAIKELIEALLTASMGQKPYFRVSVVSFGSSVSTLAEYKSETELNEDDVASFTAQSGSTNVAAAFEEVKRIVQAHPGTETDFEPFVFFLSDGQPDNAELAVKAVNDVKNISIPSGSPHIVSLGFGNVDDTFMKKIASNSELYKKLNSSKDIVKLLPAIGTIGTMAQGSGADSVKTAIMKL